MPMTRCTYFIQVNFYGHFCTKFHRANDATSRPLGVQLNSHITSIMERLLSVSPFSACHFQHHRYCISHFASSHADIQNVFFLTICQHGSIVSNASPCMAQQQETSANSKKNSAQVMSDMKYLKMIYVT